MAVFQSLGRDSGCSSQAAAQATLAYYCVSIPRSGFWVFKPARATRAQASRQVSIPRSGFWVFKLALKALVEGADPEFQSLGRDSGCSSRRYSYELVTDITVSIPRSGF